MKASNWYFSILFLTLYGCLEPYSPPELALGEDLLVVDGFLTSGSGGEIRLSRTGNLSEENGSIAETGAYIELESEGGNLLPLKEATPGKYVLQVGKPAVGEAYSLRITTSNGKQYKSDFVTLKQTPAIDSVYWAADLTEGEIGIFLSTHDPSGSTRKYSPFVPKSARSRLIYAIKIKKLAKYTPSRTGVS